MIGTVEVCFGIVCVGDRRSKVVLVIVRGSASNDVLGKVLRVKIPAVKADA